MKQPLALAACLIALVVSAKAQPLLLPPPAYAHAVPMAALPPHEIAALMRSSGLRPLHRPVRQGRVYVVRAINPAGEEVGAVVDARSGRILRINPMLIPPNALPVVPAALRSGVGADGRVSRRHEHERSPCRASTPRGARVLSLDAAGRSWWGIACTGWRAALAAAAAQGGGDAGARQDRDRRAASDTGRRPTGCCAGARPGPAGRVRPVESR